MMWPMFLMKRKNKNKVVKELQGELIGICRLIVNKKVKAYLQLFLSKF